jgi:hypothetical protein
MESNVVLMIVFRYIFQSPHRKWSTLKPSPRRGYTREHPKVVWCVWAMRGFDPEVYEIRHSEHIIDGLSPRHKSMAGLIKSIRGFRDPMYH